jgi:hypothetical protein
MLVKLSYPFRKKYNFIAEKKINGCADPELNHIPKTCKDANT